MIIGVYKDKAEKKLLAEKCDKLIELNVENLKVSASAKDTYIFNNVYSLGLSIVSTDEFLKCMALRDVAIEFLDLNDLGDIEVNQFFDVAAHIHSKISSNRTRESLAIAKTKGIIGGRPTIASEKIQEMQKLYQNKYTMREISRICNVSLGTVYKYCHDLA